MNTKPAGIASLADPLRFKATTSAVSRSPATALPPSPVPSRTAPRVL